MDANRDEAIRCLKIADKHAIQGNVAEAKRFIVKAQKLLPGIDVSRFDSIFANNGSNQNTRKQRSPSRERRFSREEEMDSNASQSRNSKESSKPFKKNELCPIRKILATKDHYQVLGVSKSATTDEIKKAYKLLALKYHPDKNQAPGAIEAFKKIGQSMEILADPAKRKRFDDFGIEDEVAAAPRRRPDVFYQYETHQGFDADVFNMFFNAGFPFAQFNHGGRQQRQQPRHQESDREGNYFVYLQLLPLIILFGLSFFSSFMVREPYFSLQRTQKYPDERLTQAYRVPYFVKSTFTQDFSGNLPQLERQIEEEYVSTLRFKCFREKESKEALIYRARYFNDEEAYLRAQKVSVPSCDRLNAMFHQGD